MGILNPVVSKTNLSAGNGSEIYVCPANKSHAIVDVSFFKDDWNQSSLISIALSSDSNPANLTSVDYFVDDIELISTVNSAELNKVIVGQGERLHVKVLSGSDVNIRLSGVEEANPKVIKGGRLAATAVAGTSQTQIFSNSWQDVAYISASITIYNADPNDDATIEMWITSSASPATADKVMNIALTPEDTTIVENLLLKPNEKVFVRSSKANAEYFVNGLVIGV